MNESRGEPLEFIVEEDPDGGYTARAVGEAIFTQGENVDDLKTMIRDAIECHFDEPGQRPSRVKLQFVKDELSAL